MNQNEFFNILMDGLKDFPESKLRDIISYYDNKFTHGISLGKTEEEIITELGNPNLIVNQYKSEFLDAEDSSTPFNTEGSSSSETKNSTIEKLNYEFSSDTILTNNTSDSFTTIENNSTGFNDYDEISLKDNYFNSTSPINNSKIATDDEILSTANITSSNYNTDQSSNSFTINDTLDNSEGILTAQNNLNSNLDSSLNDSNLDDAKYSPPHENINSNTDFYNLYTNNQPVESNEGNYTNNTSDRQNYNYNSSNSNSKNSQSTVNLILKICIIVVTLLIFSPVITGIIGCIIGLFGVAISILVGSIGLLVGGTFTSLVGVPNVPLFVANFPYPVIVLFSLGSISLSLFLTLVFYYLCKFFVRLLIKAYRALKLKGGDL